MIKIKIQNIDQLMRAYGRVGQIVKKEMKDALNKSAAVVERAAKRKTPVDTGTLRRSIQKPRRARAGDKRVAVGSNVRYAEYVHGTPEHPRGYFIRHKTGEAEFLDKALKQNEKKINRFFKQMVHNIIKSLEVLR